MVLVLGDHGLKPGGGVIKASKVCSLDRCTYFWQSKAMEHIYDKTDPLMNYEGFLLGTFPN